MRLVALIVTVTIFGEVKKAAFAAVAMLQLLLVLSASVSASTAQSGQDLELGLSGSFTHDLTVLTEHGRRV